MTTVTKEVELNFRFANRLKVREVARILLENQEADIWVIVWPLGPRGGSHYITVSVVPTDRNFVSRILATDGIPSMDTRDKMVQEASKWLEMYQGEKARQFAAWTKG